MEDRFFQRTFANIVVQRSMAHCRRYWWEAIGNDSRRTHEAISYIARLGMVWGHTTFADGFIPIFLTRPILPSVIPQTGVSQSESYDYSARSVENAGLTEACLGCEDDFCMGMSCCWNS